jgi:hypothetical protein
VPESTRRIEPGELAERLAEAFLADFWAAQPRGEATVRVGDEDRVLVYRSTPEVQRQLYRLDGLRLLAPGTMAAVVRFLVEAVELPDTPLTEEAPWALPAGDPLAMVRAIDQDLTRRMAAYARERGVRLGEGEAEGHTHG